VKGLLIAFPLVLLLVSIQDRVKMLKEPIGIGLILPLVSTVVSVYKYVPSKVQFCQKNVPIYKKLPNLSVISYQLLDVSFQFTVEQVYAGYVQDLYILQGVNFRIAPGELVTVIGPNGAGKSTLAKAIFGLLKPSAGTITFKGKNIAGWKSNQIVTLGMGYVPQIANVFPSLSIEENLEMGAFTSKGNIKSLKANDVRSRLCFRKWSRSFSGIGSRFTQ